MADDLELLELGEDLEELEDYEDLEDLEDPFLGGIGGKIKSIVAKITRKCGPKVGKCALGVIKSELPFGGLFEDYEDLEDLEDPFLGGLGGKVKSIAAKIARKCGAKAGKCALSVLKSELGILGGLFEDQEDFEDYEGDFEDYEDNFGDMEGDFEDYEVPAEMAILAQEAAEAETEAEADAFFGALAGLLPKVLPVAKKFLPHIIRGGKAIVGKLFRRRRGRRRRAAMEAMPAITITAAKKLARQAAAGTPVTTAGAARTMAGVAGRVLGNRRTLLKCLRRCRRLAAAHRGRVRTAA